MAEFAKAQHGVVEANFEETNATSKPSVCKATVQSKRQEQIAVEKERIVGANVRIDAVQRNSVYSKKRWKRKTSAVFMNFFYKT